MLRAAIASNDGITVNENFGKSKEFYIYDIEYGVPFFLEKRKTPEYSQNNGQVFFDTKRFEDIYKSIMDCDLVVAKKMGKKPQEELQARGVESLICEKKINFLIFNNKKNGE
jgi:nitrogen fixation protein NifB